MTTYSASGVRGGEGPTFGEHLASKAGQAQLQAFRKRVDTRLQDELHLISKAGAIVPCFACHIGGIQRCACPAQLKPFCVSSPARLTADVSNGTKAGKCADEEERKVALVLAAGLRADRRTAEILLNDKDVRRRSLAGWRQHVEALRMYNYPSSNVSVHTLRLGLKTNFVPRMEFVALHACALRSSCPCNAVETNSHVTVMQRAIHACRDPVAAGCGVANTSKISLDLTAPEAK